MTLFQKITGILSLVTFFLFFVFGIELDRLMGMHSSSSSFQDGLGFFSIFTSGYTYFAIFSVLFCLSSLGGIWNHSLKSSSDTLDANSNFPMGTRTFIWNILKKYILFFFVETIIFGIGMLTAHDWSGLLYIILYSGISLIASIAFIVELIYKLSHRK